MTASKLTDMLQALECLLRSEGEQDQRSSDDWLSDLKEKVDRLNIAFDAEVEHQHKEQFEQIREQDIALQPRIKAMQQEDRRLVALMVELQISLDAIEPATLKQDRIRRITKRVQGVVSDIRNQQLALSKWFSESFLRARGFSS